MNFDWLSQTFLSQVWEDKSITTALQEQLMAIKPKNGFIGSCLFLVRGRKKCPEVGSSLSPRFLPEKEGKKQYREAANLNRANTQGDIYPFANTMVFQNVTRASESLWPLRRKKYVHDTLEHNVRYIRTQTNSTSESILYNTPVLDLTCKNRTSWEYMEEVERECRSESL